MIPRTQNAEQNSVARDANTYHSSRIVVTLEEGQAAMGAGREDLAVPFCVTQ